MKSFNAPGNREFRYNGWEQVSLIVSPGGGFFFFVRCNVGKRKLTQTAAVSIYCLKLDYGGCGTTLRNKHWHALFCGSRTFYLIILFNLNKWAFPALSRVLYYTVGKAVFLSFICLFVCFVLFMGGFTCTTTEEIFHTARFWHHYHL